MSRPKISHVWVVSINGEPETAFTSEASADRYAVEENFRDLEACQEANAGAITRRRRYFTWARVPLFRGDPS